MKHSPEYRPEAPYSYPLFKIHKLNQEQINNKITPPSRMVNAAKYGPLYRVEKRISPPLTSASQIYSKNEYIKDTPHLTELINPWSGQRTYIYVKSRCNNANQTYFNLFTISATSAGKTICSSIKPEDVHIRR